MSFVKPIDADKFTASYIVYKKYSVYYAKACFTGGQDFSGLDASTVINAAINGLSGTYKSGIILLRDGTYSISSSIILHKNTKLKGSGKLTTILSLTSATNCVEITASEGSGDCEIRSLMINMNSRAGNGINASGLFWGGIIEDVSILGVADNESGDPSLDCSAIKIAGIFNSKISHVDISGGKGHGVYLTGILSSGIAYGNSILEDISVDLSNATAGRTVYGFRFERTGGINGSASCAITQMRRLSVFGGSKIGVSFKDETTSATIIEYLQCEYVNVGVQLDNTGNVSVNGGMIRGSGTSSNGIQLLNAVGLVQIRDMNIVADTTVNDTSTQGDSQNKNILENCYLYGSLILTRNTVLRNSKWNTTYFTYTTDSFIYHPSLLTTDKTYIGEVIVLTQSTAWSEFGKIEYLGTDGTCNNIDADALSTMPTIGIVVQASAHNDWMAGNVRLLTKGIVRNDAWNWTIGLPIYASGTSGALTQTPPSGNGKVTQKLGYAVTATVIFFNPVNYYLVTNTATITADNTYVDVIHGLAFTPSLNKIKLHPQDTLSGRTLWVSDVGATTFRINLSCLDAVNHVIGWSYGE